MPAAPVGQRLAQALGVAGAAGQPERQAELAHLRQVDLVARPVDRLAALVARRLAARRRVVPARGRALDDEAVDASGRLLRQHGGERVAGDDGQEARPLERRGRRRREWSAGIEAQELEALGRRALDVELQRGRLVLGQRVERARDLARDAGAHQHVVDAGEHRAVEQRQVRAAAPWSAGSCRPTPSWPSLARYTSTKAASIEICWRASRAGRRSSGSRRYGVPGGGPRDGSSVSSVSSATPGIGKRAMARRRCPPASPSCSRRTKMVSSPVPETTPSWPVRETGVGQAPAGDADPHAALDDAGQGARSRRGLGRLGGDIERHRRSLPQGRGDPDRVPCSHGPRWRSPGSGGTSPSYASRRDAGKPGVDGARPAATAHEERGRPPRRPRNPGTTRRRRAPSTAPPRRAKRAGNAWARNPGTFGAMPATQRDERRGLKPPAYS